MQPENSLLCNLIGSIYEQMDNHKEAYDYYLKAIKTEPYNKDFWVDIIELLNNNGKEKNAQAVLKKALQCFPNDESFTKLQLTN
jgi:tetratricopeptide (TPR) repeat protein